MTPRPAGSTLFPYTTLFRSRQRGLLAFGPATGRSDRQHATADHLLGHARAGPLDDADALRSEEHTSELQSRGHLVCRLLLEKKKTCKILHLSRHGSLIEVRP